MKPASIVAVVTLMLSVTGLAQAQTACVYPQAPQTFPDVVHYVYGDSGRWLDVWGARERGVSLFTVFWNLTRMGLRGAWVCLTIVLRFVWARMRKFKDSRFRRVAEAKA